MLVEDAASVVAWTAVGEGVVIGARTCSDPAGDSRAVSIISDRSAITVRSRLDKVEEVSNRRANVGRGGEGRLVLSPDELSKQIEHFFKERE